jgi:hypothetical protein
MSSATSTNEPRPAPNDQGLQPWQFFVLAALGCATALTFIARGQGPIAVILLGVLMATAALVGYATLRAVRPLVSPEEDRTAMIGQRTRVALEREKMLALRSIKELEFDRAMGRVSDEDFKEMSGRLRTRAARLIRQLDAGTGYRDLIERELQKRLESKKDDGAGAARLKGSRFNDEDSQSTRVTDNRSVSLSDERDAEHVCLACETSNDADAKFCKGCGQALAPR